MLAEGAVYCLVRVAWQRVGQGHACWQRLQRTSAKGTVQPSHPPVCLPPGPLRPFKQQHALLQVCLAAERCGHLRFDARADMWWRSEGFRCADGPPGAAAAHGGGGIGFWDIYCKVGRHDLLQLPSRPPRPADR